MGRKDATTVLIVEDDPKTQELLALMFAGAGHRVLLASSAEGALLALGSALPDVLIVDLILPGESGVSLMRRLRGDARTRDLAILVLSARCLEEEKVLALEAGADDFVTEPFSAKELLARVDAVLRRGPVQRVENGIEIAGLRIDPATRHATAGDRTLDLTSVEFRLLHYLMSNPGRVCTRTQLLDHVWGADQSIEGRSVDVHIGRLRRGLALSGHDRLIETVRGSGYRCRAA